MRATSIAAGAERDCAPAAPIGRMSAALNFTVRVPVRVAVLSLALAAFMLACSSEPKHDLIDGAYFKCESSRSLEGGIYGKGPLLRFGPQPSSCSSAQWVRITRGEFKVLATQWYGKDWSQEIPFWKRTDFDTYL